MMGSVKTKTTTAHSGMGSIPHSTGVTFRVWAPNAQKVFVTGDFVNWEKDKFPLEQEENGYWAADIAEAKIGSQYKFILDTPSGLLQRNDPYTREVTSSNGNSVVVDPEYAWEDTDFKMPAWNELVIYELHVGTFNVKEEGKPGNFYGVIERLSYLKALGINAIEIMPPTEFPGAFSWGYNPSHPFALEADYGGVKAFKDLVNAAHKAGIAVIIDIVYNHFGPADLDLWQFDGWNEDNKGGIYFYQDWRCKTPWGDSRPDYGRPEVRQYIRDNALIWLEEYQLDGLRTDSISYIRNVNGDTNPDTDLPDGWSLMKWINEEIKARFPWKITIAEDLKGDEWITKNEESGGQGFSTQWDAWFVNAVRDTLTTPRDEDRNMDEICTVIKNTYNGDAFQRVIYTDSHDDVAHGKARIAEEIMPGDAGNWFAKKKATLGAALVMTSPGIPMIFQGQTIQEGGWFSDTTPLNWEKFPEFKGISKLFRDLIHLRKNATGVTKGLTGQHVKIMHANNGEKVVAFHRWSEGGPKDSVVVVANFANRTLENYNIGFPEKGLWKVRFNSDWKGYDNEFGDNYSYDTETYNSMEEAEDYNANVSLAPYSVIILSRD